MSSVLWLRRDLRLGDHPALHEAAKDAPVVVLFVLDPMLLGPSGAPRVAFLFRTLRALDADLRRHGGELVVRSGDPVEVVPAVAREASAGSVHISADFMPYGTARDERVAAALSELDVPLVRTGSPYAISPGRVTKSDGSAFKVYSPYYRVWEREPLHKPAGAIADRVDWHAGLPGEAVPDDPPLPDGLSLPDAGEDAALRHWRAYRKGKLAEYGDVRNRPDLDETSHLSVYLKWGCIHPRTLLHDLGEHDGIYRRELAWREFYATVLHAWPASARSYFQPGTEYLMDAGDSPAFRAWCAGRTGYPIVDAGIRQMLAQGWMHNRVRMIVASFLCKDLHVDWRLGARYFMAHLVDGDLPSNQHGWQWVAGTGTDPAPFYRIFNPITQGVKFDPAGDYVRRFVPELSGVPGKAVHEPWALPEGVPDGYPERIVDHATERTVALDRYHAARG